MYKKIFATVLFSIVFTLSSISQNYSMEKTENTLGNQSDSNKVSLENIYYKENPWDFVENYLMMHPGKTEAWFFLVEIAIVYSSLVSAVLASIGIGAAFEKIFNTDAFGIFMGTAAVSGAIGGIVAAVAFHKYMSSPVMRYENLISILKNYDPDINNTNLKNTKFYIPKQLHAIFDALWMVYKEQGEKFLKAEWDKVAEKIMNKIKYEIKPMKYQEMTVKVVY